MIKRYFIENIHDPNGSPTTMKIDTFDGDKPRFLNRGKKRRSVSTLSIPRASDRGVEWVDLLIRRGGPPCLPAGRCGRLLSLSKDREPPERLPYIY